MKEFDLIKKYFTEQVIKRKDVMLGIGDDCAIVNSIKEQQIAVTTDTLVAGVHFPLETSPRAIGHKSVVVNLSDLAAMGAEPAWISLAITLPDVDEAWIDEFCQGVFDVCEYYNVQLIGGDTTQGPLSITITAQGLLPAEKYTARSGAKPGDWVYVTGELGDAALALQHIQNKIELDESYQEAVHKRLNFPKPRILAGQAIRGYASSAIDLSDGLISDITHIIKASNVGANIVLDNLPISQASIDTLGEDNARELALKGGDDYELLFTVSENNKVALETSMGNTRNVITCIGQLNNSNKLTVTSNSKAIDINAKGYEHFSQENSK